MRLYGLNPHLVGGCRLLDLRTAVPATGFHLDYAQIVTRFGVASQVLVARRISCEDA